jgi:hypothetical protein
VFQVRRKTIVKETLAEYGQAKGRSEFTPQFHLESTQLAGWHEDSSEVPSSSKSQYDLFPTNNPLYQRTPI